LRRRGNPLGHDQVRAPLSRVMQRNLRSQPLPRPPGKMPGTIDSIHQLACPDEKTLYLANLYENRLDKWMAE
jgi:hypothetical protein